MKLMALSDIHHRRQKWWQLVDHVRQHKPDVVAIAGDLLPKDSGIPEQLTFLNDLISKCEDIKNEGVELVLMLGNDDNQNLIPKFKELDDQGLFHFVHDKVVDINGYEFVGMPWVKDYPFTYKFWVKADMMQDMAINKIQYGTPIVLSENNTFIDIKEDFRAYLNKKGTLEDSLNTLASQVKNINKSIWLIHCPPVSCGLDVCYSSERVGSSAILQFILDKQPMLTIHGHIHESPEVTGRWKCQIDNTWAINAGQIKHDLHYTIIDIEDDKVNTITHSIYE